MQYSPRKVSHDEWRRVEKWRSVITTVTTAVATTVITTVNHEVTLVIAAVLLSLIHI